MLCQVQDDVFRSTRLPQFSRQPDADCAGDPSSDLIVLPYTRDFRVTNTICQAIESAGRACMGIGSENHLARHRNLFPNDRMTNAGASTGSRSVEVNTGFARQTFLPFTKIPDPGEGFGGDTRKTSSKRQMIWKCMDRIRIFHVRFPAKRRSDQRSRRRCCVVVGEAGVDLNEPGIARFHPTVDRLHMTCEDFLGDRHWPRWRIDRSIRFLSSRPCLHEPEQTAVSCNPLRELVKRDGQFLEANALTHSQAPAKQQIRYRKHAIIDEILTMDRCHAGGVNNPDPGI